MSSVASDFSQAASAWKTKCLTSAASSGMDATSMVSAVTPDDLRSEVKAYFHSSFSDGETASSGLSPEQALAMLLQELGPAFASSSHYSSRVLALYVVCGALEGCQTHGQISNNLLELLSEFLLSHCGPIQDDEDEEEDYDAQIRDAALQCIVALLRLSLDSETINEEEMVLASIRKRVEIAQNAVELRCAAQEEDRITFDYGFGGRQQPDILGGLSHLPRSKRSLCFTALQSGVLGIDSVLRSPPWSSHPLSDNGIAAIQPSLVQFSLFSSKCLQGESDPRCLQQLLQLFHSIQASFNPLFRTCPDAAHTFPIAAFFDSVAPYFPIQFTPPPNNPHGITRAGLHETLLSVLCFTVYDECARQFHRPTMGNLAAGLFLEQLLPNAFEPDDPPPTTVEQLEAVEALDQLLFVRNGDRNECANLDLETVKSLSKGLITVHEESSLSSTKGGDIGPTNKQLAVACRDIVSKVAFSLESASSAESLWEAFVLAPLRTLAKALALTPSSCRTGIAYIACLEASGGPRSLRSCLDMCMEPLLTMLEKRDEKKPSDENLAAACYALGALFSSCRVAMDRARQNGIELHPHPLTDWSSRAVQVLPPIATDPGLSPVACTGAIRALETVILATPPGIVAEPVMQEVVKFATYLLDSFTSTSVDSTVKDACAHSLGEMVGASFGLSSHGLLADDTLKSHLQDTILNRVVSEASVPGGAVNYPLALLGTASKYNGEAATRILGWLKKELAKCLATESLEGDAVLRSAEILSSILREGETVAAQSYHKFREDLEAPTHIVNAIISAASRTLSKTDKVDLMQSVRTLALPSTPEERLSVYHAIQISRRLTSKLLPAYLVRVPDEGMIALLEGVGNVLPPLSENDTIALSVTLPLLATALRRYETPADGMDTDEKTPAQLMESLLYPLVEYAASDDIDGASREAAAMCLHFIIATYNSRKVCPVAGLLKETLTPLLKQFKDSAEAASAGEKTKLERQFANFMSLLSVLGSGAVSRGKSSTKVGDDILGMLERFTFDGSLAVPLNGNAVFDIDVNALLAGAPRFTMAVIEAQCRAANAFGAILITQSMSPLVRQRMVHSSMRRMRDFLKEKGEMAPSIGLSAIAAHVVCSCSVSSLTEADVMMLAGVVVGSFSSDIFMSPAPEVFHSVKRVILAAVVKLIATHPSSMTGKLSVIVGLLRALATADPARELPVKMLALQGLETLAHAGSPKVVVEEFKPAVISVLAAVLDHPSTILRQAAVDARNAWYVLE